MSSNKSIAKSEQSSVKERLLKYIETKHLNASQFLDIVGLSRTYISNMRHGVKPKTFDDNIAPAFPDLNKAWLLYGEGEMILGNGNEEKKEENNSNASLIKNKPHDEQMQVLYDKIEALEKQLHDNKNDSKELADKIIEIIGKERTAITDVIEDLKKDLNLQKKGSSKSSF